MMIEAQLHQIIFKLHHPVSFVLVRKLKQKCLFLHTVKSGSTGRCSNAVFVLFQPSISPR